MSVLTAPGAHPLRPAGMLLHAFLFGHNPDQRLGQAVGRRPCVAAVAVALEGDGASGTAFAVVELVGGFVAGVVAAPVPDRPEVVACEDFSGDFDVFGCGGEGEADLAGVGG